MSKTNFELHLKQQKIKEIVQKIYKFGAVRIESTMCQLRNVFDVKFFKALRIKCYLYFFKLTGAIAFLNEMIFV